MCIFVCVRARFGGIVCLALYDAPPSHTIMVLERERAREIKRKGEDMDVGEGG